MNIWKRPMRTNGLLWFMFTAALYLSAMCMPTGVAKSPYFGFVWLGLLSTNSFDLYRSLMGNLCIAAAAAILGWIAQAVLIAVFTRAGAVVSSAASRSGQQHRGTACGKEDRK
jgi:hypothetical protein